MTIPTTSPAVTSPAITSPAVAVTGLERPRIPETEAEVMMACLDSLFHTRTGQHLSDLQRVILHLGLKGKRYLEIADAYGCTEGHAKDVGSKLWRVLSHTLGEKVTKQNLRSAVARGLQRARRLKRLGQQAPLGQGIMPSHGLSLNRSDSSHDSRSFPFLDSAACRLDPAARWLFQWSWERPH